MFTFIGPAMLIAFAAALGVGYILDTRSLRRSNLIRVLGDQLAAEEEYSEAVLRDSGALLVKARRFLEQSPLEGVMDVVDEIDAYLLAYEGEDDDRRCTSETPFSCRGECALEGED